MAKPKCAWVIEWEWIGEHRRVEPNILHILPYQWGPGRVGDYMATLALNSPMFMPSERLGIYRKRREHSLFRHWCEGPRIYCGSNPFLAAHLAKDLRFRTDPDTLDEIVEWTNLPGLRYDSTTEKMDTMGEPIPRIVRINTKGVRLPD